jgi:hypothetical protein
VSTCTLPAEDGRDYYVSPSGSDRHAGTPEAPLRTIAAAAALLKPGDTCFVGPEPITGWTRHSHRVLKARVGHPVEQVVRDGRMLTRAHRS